MTVYAGTSAFFANRKGNHNWLDNNNRPFLSLITTAPDGSRSYNDLFLNKSVQAKVTKTGKVTITFDADTNQPLFRVITKGETA
jgi:DNA-binding beta-propeller fold protein YncE